jgi:hypothetical protein
LKTTYDDFGIAFPNSQRPGGPGGNGNRLAAWYRCFTIQTLAKMMIRVHAAMIIAIEMVWLVASHNSDTLTVINDG